MTAHKVKTSHSRYDIKYGTDGLLVSKIKLVIYTTHTWACRANRNESHHLYGCLNSA